jgi:phosphomannomutase
VDVAGEESGGFALGRFGCDKDGMLAALLLAERMASDAAPLSRRLAALQARHGPRACGRSAVPATPAARVRLARLAAAPPAAVEGSRVRNADRRDGLHLALDDGFLMLRASGTEAVLRIYAEAPAAPSLSRRLAHGRGLLLG